MGILRNTSSYKKRITGFIPLVALIAGTLILIFGCGTSRKVRDLHDGLITADIRLPQNETSLPEYVVNKIHRDTLTVTDDKGHEMLIMKAVRDEDGEMTATDVLDAAVVTARFRNVAERHGRVALEFQVTVPLAMQESAWQTRLYPDLFVLGDSVRLDAVVITGFDYRKAQLKGYERYERFLSTIINDSTLFIDLRDLEIFLKRNIPELYAMRNDSTEVSDEQFASIFGVTQREAIEHYTKQAAVRRNEKRKDKKERMFGRYVKAPITSESLRLDTVMRAANGDFIYNYIQIIDIQPNLRKADIVLSGEILEEGKRIYDIPASNPLTFYISSLSTLTDNTERYVQKIIERKAEADADYLVEFAAGSDKVDLNLGENASEMGYIRTTLKSLLENETFDLDSITVNATCSPEGIWTTNLALSKRRSRSIADYYRGWINLYADSLQREKGIAIDEQGREEYVYKKAEIRFVLGENAEDWESLDRLVAQDTIMLESDKASYDVLRLEENPDTRERMMAVKPWYNDVKDRLYPKLRRVNLGFHMHRKGMVKDTIHTTEIDSVYMEGVQAIRDRHYERALTLLRPYEDYNTAVAYSLLDRNLSALQILEGLENKDAKVAYLLSIIWARQGDEQKAVKYFLDACTLEPSYRHRGNLDPEISILIRTYGLNREYDGDF